MNNLFHGVVLDVAFIVSRDRYNDLVEKNKNILIVLKRIGKKKTTKRVERIGKRTISADRINCRPSWDG